MASRTPSVLDNYPSYELTIGFEVHVQLTTKTKIFCSCANEVIKEPNKNICEICTAQPGVLPVLNKQVVESGIRAGLATNCQINKINEFDRKHYFYPDLPKNYQITQNVRPICIEGHIPIRLEDDSIKKVRLTRIHMEEDAGKNTHSDVGAESFVDLNRAGTPLLEMVSYPDISSTYEARTYLKTLHSIITYLDISSGNMEEGAFRADTNISVRKKGASQYGTKVELKNINSFKFITDAIEYEIERQIETLEAGGKIRQETRLWDSKEKKTYIMRSKEEAADYRFFPDPDLPLVEIDDAWITRVQQAMPELPDARMARYVGYGLSNYEAEILVTDRELATYFEQAHKLSTSKQVVNWILRDLLSHLKEKNLTPTQAKVTPEKLVTIIQLLEQDKINNHAARELFETISEHGGDPLALVKERGLEQMGASAELEQIIKNLVAQHPAEAAEYKAGKERLFGFFVGSAMKLTQGKGNPKIIQELLKKFLSQ
jgi:aspartyl-tRNA(Asn)/glutamyl-tRNA(Gln) amidotransferase subunit B